MSPDGRPTGADLLVDCLVAEGVNEVFGLPGTTIMDVIDSLGRNPDTRFISTRHEQVAGFMADGYSRSGRGIGVALVSRGPGAANLSIAVQNAHDESIPMLALVGQVPSDIYERGSFEEMDVVSSFRPLAKWAVEVHHADRIPELVQRAVRTAISGRPGPVVVSFPLNVLQAAAEARPQPRVRFEMPAMSADALERAVGILDQAEAPAIVLGGGAHDVAWDALAELAEALDAPVVTTWLRKGAFPNDHPNFTGCLGYGAFDLSERIVREADVILSIGCRFSEFTTRRWSLLSERTKLIQIDIDESEIGRNYLPSLGVVADAVNAVRQLNRRLKPEQAPVRARSVSDLRAELDRVMDEDLGQERQRKTAHGLISSADLVDALQDVAARPDVIVVQDVHTFGPWIQRYLSFARPGSYYGSPGGAMAWGFPAGLGIAVGRPDRRVVAVSGDGSFWMVAQDLETAVRESIPVVSVVVNNFAYGNTRDRQASAHEGRYNGVLLGNPDFASFAENLGARGFRATTPVELKQALAGALEHPGPSCIDVIQDQFEGLPAGLQPPRAH